MSFTGVSLEDVESILDQRALKVKRRPGNAKPSKDVASGGEQKHDHCPINGESPEITNSKGKDRTELPSETQDSNLKCYSFKQLDFIQLHSLCRRPAVLDSPKILSLVKPIIEQVQTKGDKALIELTEKFDKAKLSCPVVNTASIRDVALDKDVQQAIDVAYDNIYKFHRAQLQLDPLVVETCPGVICSRHVRPIEKVKSITLVIK